MDKRGFELAINTIILIALGVLALIVIIIVWASQSGYFADFLENIRGKTNVDSLVTSCNSLVSQNSVYEYCCVKTDVRLENQELELSCQELNTKDFTGNRIKELNCDNAGCS